MDIYDYLKNNNYPGRGLIVGKYNEKMVVAYFIMGRSENSRNRIFKKDGDRVYTKAYDESKVKDPSLIIYNAFRKINDMSIVTNGNQTDTIYDFLESGRTFKEALETRDYEPDEPNYTPRISAIVYDENNYEISILKNNNGKCERLYYNFEARSNIGHFISTYDCDGNPLPAFSKEPLEIDIDCNIEEFSDKLWNSLNIDNKISLYVRYFDNKDTKDIILNKNGD